MKEEVKNFLQWFSNLDREDQLEIHAKIAKAIKPSLSYLLVKPTENDLGIFIQAIYCLNLDIPGPELITTESGKEMVRFAFTDINIRNAVSHEMTFIKGGGKCQRKRK